MPNQEACAAIVGEYMGNSCKSKSWPELENMDADDAVDKISEEYPKARVHKVPAGADVTDDHRSKRVRVFYDTSNKVVGCPRNG